MSLFDFVRKKLRELFGPPDPPDPREQLEALLQRLQEELREAKIQAADMIREEKRIRAERDEYRFKAHQAEETAMAALRNGQETIARRHLERKLDNEQIAAELEAQRLAIEERVDALREAIETYRLEIERVEREQRTWEMRERTARLKSAAHREVSTAALAEARTLLRSSRDSALREEARAEVREIVDRSQQAFRRPAYRASPEVEKELDRLRNRLAE